MDVDLDRYADPPDDPASRAARREALLDQLGWLVDEADALAPVLATLPEWAVEAVPLPGQASAKETLLALAHRDRAVYPQWIARVIAEDTPTLDVPGEAPAASANAQILDVLLGEVRDARAAFIAAMKSVAEEDWARMATLEDETLSLYDLVLRIVRHDADRLRDLAYRLHEANLTGRPQDLPK